MVLNSYGLLQLLYICNVSSCFWQLQSTACAASKISQHPPQFVKSFASLLQSGFIAMNELKTRLQCFPVAIRYVGQRVCKACDKWQWQEIEANIQYVFLCGAWYTLYFRCWNIHKVENAKVSGVWLKATGQHIIPTLDFHNLMF